MWTVDPSYKGLGSDIAGCDGDQVRLDDEYVRTHRVKIELETEIE